MGIVCEGCLERLFKQAERLRRGGRNSESFYRGVLERNTVVFAAWRDPDKGGKLSYIILKGRTGLHAEGWGCIAFRDATSAYAARDLLVPMARFSIAQPNANGRGNDMLSIIENHGGNWPNGIDPDAEGLVWFVVPKANLDACWAELEAFIEIGMMQ